MSEEHQPFRPHLNFAANITAMADGAVNAAKLAAILKKKDAEIARLRTALEAIKDRSDLMVGIIGSHTTIHRIATDALNPQSIDK